MERTSGWPLFAGRRVIKLHKGLHKAESSILVQARTGKIGLRDFLFKRRVLGFDSPWCDCGQGRETVRHILVFCSRERERREQLVQDLGEPVDTDRMLDTPGKAGIIARWLLHSGRLHVPARKPTYHLGSGCAEPELGMAGQTAEGSGSTQRNLGFSSDQTSAWNGFPRLRQEGGPHDLDRSLGVRTIIMIVACLARHCIWKEF